jgi:hypothetical protein
MEVCHMYLDGRLDEIDAEMCKEKKITSTPVVKEEVCAPSYPVWRAYINGNIHPDSPYAKEIVEPATPVIRQDEYRVACLANWKKEHTRYAKARSTFRQWKVTYNADGVAVSCSFQVKKDGAHYTDIPLPLNTNTLPALRVFATAFDVPYRHNLPRDQLLEILKPVIHLLCYPPYPYNRRR